MDSKTKPNSNAPLMRDVESVLSELNELFPENEGEMFKEQFEFGKTDDIQTSRKKVMDEINDDFNF